MIRGRAGRLLISYHLLPGLAGWFLALNMDTGISAELIGIGVVNFRVRLRVLDPGLMVLDAAIRNSMRKPSCRTDGVLGSIMSK